MAKSIKKLLKSFTLIELIIVIAIVAVLWASAFLVLSQWMSKWRDSRRISDLATLEKTIQLSFVTKESVIYPDPDPSIEIKTDDYWVLWYQGKFWPALTDYVSNLNKIPKDPSWNYYEYSLTEDKKYYMLTAFLENERQLSYLWKAFAQESQQTYVLTNYDGYIIKKIGLEVYLIKTQSLLVNPEKIDYTQPEYEVNLDEDILSSNASVSEIVQVFTGNITSLLDDDPTNDDVWLEEIENNFPELKDTQNLTDIINVAKTVEETITCKWTLPVNAQSNGAFSGDVNWSYNETPWVCTYICKSWYNHNNWTCELAPTVIKVVGDDTSWRSWWNGKYWTTCNTYLNPPDGFEYDGEIWDWVYIIDPDGNGWNDPFKVFCDMTSLDWPWVLAATNGWWWTTSVDPSTSYDFPLSRTVTKWVWNASRLCNTWTPCIVEVKVVNVTLWDKYQYITNQPVANISNLGSWAPGCDMSWKICMQYSSPWVRWNVSIYDWNDTSWWTFRWQSSTGKWLLNVYQWHTKNASIPRFVNEFRIKTAFDKQECKWSFPTNAVVNWTISNSWTWTYSATAWTCKFDCKSGYMFQNWSCVVDPNIIVISWDNIAWRKWADWSYSATCNEYKNPTWSKVYAGDNWDWVYWIDPDLSWWNDPFKVYCDMTTDGWWWTLLLASGLAFDRTSEFWNGNLNSSVSYTYSWFTFNSKDSETMFKSLSFKDVFFNWNTLTIYRSSATSTFVDKKTNQTSWSFLSWWVNGTLEWNHTDRDGYTYWDFLLGVRWWAAWFGDYVHYFIWWNMRSSTGLNTCYFDGSTMGIGRTTHRWAYSWFNSGYNSGGSCTASNPTWSLTMFVR